MDDCTGVRRMEPLNIRAGGYDGLWGPIEVAAFLRVSRSWIYQKAEAGLLPVIRLPGSSLLRFDPEKVRAYVRGDWKPAEIVPLNRSRRR